VSEMPCRASGFFIRMHRVGRRSWLRKSMAGLMILEMMAFQWLPCFTTAAAAQEARQAAAGGGEAAQAWGGITFGGRFGEDTAEGYADALVPVWQGMGGFCSSILGYPGRTPGRRSSTLGRGGGVLLARG